MICNYTHLLEFNWGIFNSFSSALRRYKTITKDMKSKKPLFLPTKGQPMGDKSSIKKYIVAPKKREREECLDFLKKIIKKSDKNIITSDAPNNGKSKIKLPITVLNSPQKIRDRLE